MTRKPFSITAMKRNLLFVAILAVITSCSIVEIDNNEVTEQPAVKVNVNISIADLTGKTGQETKAIKTAWAVGDKVNIWFDAAYWTTAPQLVLTRTAEGWSSSYVNPLVLSSTGTLKVIYENSNSMFSSALDETAGFATASFNFPGGKQTIPFTPLTCYKEGVEYTYENNTLTASIDGWTYLTGIQVVVKGLNGANAANYALKVDCTSRDEAARSFKNVAGYAFNAGFQAYSSTAGGWAGGIENEDGVAFCFASASVWASHGYNYTFSLYDKTSGKTRTYEIYDKDFSASLSSNQCHTLNIQFAKLDALNGRFVINDTGGKVSFSRSNLSATYNGSTYDWGFADNQFSCSGGDPVETPAINYVVDQFGWSGDTYKNYGISISNNNADYDGWYYDWGATVNGGWRVLTPSEWNYLKTNTEYGFATVGGVIGLILIPAGFEDPKTRDGSYSFVKSASGTGWDMNVYTAGANWDAMEAAGAVFLPADSYGNRGLYWTKTRNGSDQAYYFEILSKSISTSYTDRFTRGSVRLVCDM